MGFVNYKTIVHCFVWNHQYFEISAEKKNVWDAPENFIIGLFTYLLLVIYHTLTLNLPFN